jgi:hypothetical protein
MWFLQCSDCFANNLFASFYRQILDQDVSSCSIPEPVEEIRQISKHPFQIEKIILQRFTEKSKRNGQLPLA